MRQLFRTPSPSHVPQRTGKVTEASVTGIEGFP